MKCCVGLSAREIDCPSCGAGIGQNCLQDRFPIWAIIWDILVDDPRAGFRGRRRVSNACKARLMCIAKEISYAAFDCHGINNVHNIQIWKYRNAVEVTFNV